jgi:predicted GIY-YIG superfamily endonuclease
MNWTGHVLSAPRARIVDVLRRPEVNRTGVYFLVGSDPNNLGQSIVYIGESDNVADRLAQHNRDEAKNFWESTCIVTNKDANLTKAHARYLESRLIQLAKKAGRAKLENSTAPDFGYLPESDISDMEYFLEQLQTLLPVLGMDFLRLAPQLARSTGVAVGEAQVIGISGSDAATGYDHYIVGQERPTIYGEESPEFTFSDHNGNIRASAVEIEGQMVILKGSEARDAESPSLASNVRLVRQQLKEAGKLVPSQKTAVLRFEEDVAFSSPSAAAQAVMATSRNGRTDWKVASTGQTYAVWQEAQIAKLMGLRREVE